MVLDTISSTNSWRIKPKSVMLDMVLSTDKLVTPEFVLDMVSSTNKLVLDTISNTNLWRIKPKFVVLDMISSKKNSMVLDKTV